MNEGVRAIWAVVHRERQALADDLGRLDDAAWEVASLCDGWAVRDVVAHLSATAVLTKRRFVPELIRAGMRPGRIVQRQVAAGRKQDPAQLLAQCRASVESTASPPLPVISRVVEIIVHGEDIRRPLGLAHGYSTEYVGAALSYLAGNRLSGIRTRLTGLRLVGSDADFTVGDGPEIEGPAVALLLAACGRDVALSELTGPGVAALARLNETGRGES
ncbi:maleylpyruvate isomerase family mycothiol-dependent enzyme [Mycobacterium sp. BMJ-28]